MQSHQSQHYRIDHQNGGRYDPGIDRWHLCDEAIWYWVSGITAIHPIVLGIDISSKYRIGIRDYEGLLILQYWSKFSFRDRKLLKFTENISRWVVSTLIYILVLDMVWGKNTWLFFSLFLVFVISRGNNKNINLI